MRYSIKYIAEIIGGRFLHYRGDDPVEHLLLDSRRLVFPDNSLFFSLKGPRRDGSLFVEELYRRGVRNFVVQEGVASVGRSGEGARMGTGEMTDANVILVDDTLAALQRLAAWHRRQFTLPVIGITGSNGKTIVKEWLNQLLEDACHIVRSPKSYNSQTGVPLSVWQLEGVHELAIFEAGISRRAEMRKLQAIIQPTIGIFTNIGEAHSEGFESLAEKAAEKLQLFDGAEVLIYCSDQPATVAAVEAWSGRLGRGGSGGVRDAVAGAGRAHAPELLAWGRGEAATLRVRDVEKKEGWTSIAAVYKEEELLFSVPFTDDASIENILHCVGVLLYLRLPVSVLRTKLPELASIAMRLELKSGINHCSIINDSYSADLSSLSIALDFLSQQQQHVRRTVILSDILESGREEGSLYGEVARALGQKNVDRLVGIGGRIGAQAAVFAQWFPGEAVFYPSVEAFKKDFNRLHFRDETILIKGARIFEFEEIDQMLSEQIHQTVLEINLNAMAQNLRQYRQLLEPGTRVMAMVKAFAYGSGSFEIANLLQFHGIDYLGVAYADEGVVLRKAGIRVPIMVMNTENSSFESLVQYNLEPVIYSFALLRSLERWLKKEGVLQFPVHIELETGMNRLGFPLSAVEELAEMLAPAMGGGAVGAAAGEGGTMSAAVGSGTGPAAGSAAVFKVQSVFSHLAASEEAQQDAFSRQQGAVYLEAVGRLQAVLPYTFLRHIANSAAILRHPELRLDMVRLGIGLYGIDPANSHRPDLQEVSTLKSTIAQIKVLHEGDTIGYNRKGVAVSGMVIATVRIGYADGYYRSLGNGIGKMWVKGRLAPVVGSVCMDMTMIDITGIPDVREGDEVVVFGKELSVNQLAHWAGTIPYEILTGVSQRVKRVYFEE
jgi:alanine racemase/UDP-N-acetylmuramyl pentapeptide synthase